MERYLVVEHLAIGGFSQIYLAIDTEQPTEQCCLVKVLDPELNPSLDFANLQQFFEAEAHALGRLNSPRTVRPHEPKLHVPQLIAYCRDRGQIYLVQEFVDGQLFDDWMVTQPVRSLDQAGQILWALLSMVQQLHDQQIIHCDLKPSNIIRRHRDGEFVLIDFGACYLGDRQESESHLDPKPLRQLTLGTPGYMPEEQAAGHLERSSDLYALGMMMVQVLTQIPPQQLVRSANGNEWQWQRHLRPSWKKLPLIEIITQMTRINPRQRYQSAQDILDDLRPLIPLEVLYKEALVDSTAVPRDRSLITPWQSDAPTLCRADRRIVHA